MMRGIKIALMLAAPFAAIAPTASCDDGIGPPGPYVSLQELDGGDQPTVQSLGVLLDVAASGGSVVRLEVAQGTLGGGSSSVACLTFLNTGTVNSAVVAVVPSQTEAVVSAFLGNPANDGGSEDGGTGGLDPNCAHTTFVPMDVSTSVVVSVGLAPSSPLSGDAGAATDADAAPSEAGPGDSSTQGGEGGEGGSGAGVAENGTGADSSSDGGAS